MNTGILIAWTVESLLWFSPVAERPAMVFNIFDVTNKQHIFTYCTHKVCVR